MANRLYQQFTMAPDYGLVLLQGYANLVQPAIASVVAQGMTYTADALGTAGNGITVTLTTGGTAGAEVVTVVGSAISVQIESTVTTQTQLKTALDGSAAAAALISVSVASGGTAVAAAAAVTLVGGIDGVSSFSMKGVSTFAHTGTGEYTLTLEDKFQELLSVKPFLQAATAVDLVPQGKSSDVVSAKTVLIRLLAGATATNPAAAQKLFVELALRNSSVT